MGNFGEISIDIKYTCHYLLEEVRELSNDGWKT